MIRDGRYLDREWVPEHLAHRNGEKNALRSALSPLVDGGWSDPEQVLLKGPSGAGKTALAKVCLREFRNAEESPPAIYCNCWRQSTEYKLLEELFEPLDLGHQLRRNVPHDELRAILRRHHEPFVVVLDEVDRLESDELLLDLVEHKEAVVIAITTQPSHWVGSLDPRLQSRVSDLRPLDVDAYGVGALADILSPRAEGALYGGVGHPDDAGAISASGLRHIADAAAGNAHDALSILRHAATAAEDAEADHITADMIDAVVDEAMADVRQRRLEQLDDHPRSVWEVLQESGAALSSRQIHERYVDVVDEARGERQVRNYLRSMADYNLVERVGAGRSTSWQAVEPLS